jgi:beta-lactamase class A
MFYLVAAQARLEEGVLAPHADLDRAMRDMIRVSSNMATNYVIDLVTGTTGDTLLEPAEMAAWAERRQWVNRYFAGYGWPELQPANLCQKLMDDLRYGRERAFVGPDGANHNRLTSNAAARLLHAVMTGQVISPARSRAVADLLRRPTDAAFIASEPAGQILGYLGEGLPEGARLWSKAGLTGWTGDPAASYRRHDVAYVELPDGPAFTLAVFSEGKAIATDETFLPSIARHAAQLIAAQSPSQAG